MRDIYQKQVRTPKSKRIVFHEYGHPTNKNDTNEAMITQLRLMKLVNQEQE